MNTHIARILAVAAALAGNLGFAAERLNCGLEFNAPAGWTMKANDQAAVLMPPDMVLERGTNEPAELYIVALLPGVKDVQDPRLISLLQGKFFPAEAHVTVTGAPRPFQAAGGSGYLHTYEALVQGAAVRVEIYVTGLPAGGAAAVMAIGRRELVMRRAPVVASVAVSLFQRAGAGAVPVEANGSLAQQWVERLRGKKLMQFSSYSSGYGSGGFNSQKTLLLAANGAYVFSRSGSVSVYTGGASGGSSSQGGAQGTWRIYEQGGQVMLQLTPAHGNVELIVLTNQAGKTFLNGNRWLVGN